MIIQSMHYENLHLDDVLPFFSKLVLVIYALWFAKFTVLSVNKCRKVTCRCKGGKKLMKNLIAQRRLMPGEVDTVLYHGANCPDGFAAAVAASIRLGEKNVLYVPCHSHGVWPIDPTTHEPLDFTGRNVVILDFSFPLKMLRRMIAASNNLLVIDHHKTAQSDLKDVADINKIFDMNRSGAVLAWRYFFPNTNIPRLFLYVEARDLWTWNLPDGEAICAALDTYEQSMELWRAWIAEDSAILTTLKEQGQQIIAYRNQVLKSICDKASYITLAGYPCVSVNANGGQLVSYVGDQLLLREKDNHIYLAAMWNYNTETQTFTVSLRSAPPVDCSKIAQRFDGGGHERASAFKIHNKSRRRKEWLRAIGLPVESNCVLYIVLIIFIYYINLL